LLSTYLPEFFQSHLPRLIEAHLGLVLLKQNEFVGTKALSLSLKFLSTVSIKKEYRDLISSNFQTILYQISLPVFMMSEKEQ
jgi:hypothetical protein